MAVSFRRKVFRLFTVSFSSDFAPALGNDTWFSYSTLIALVQ